MKDKLFKTLNNNLYYYDSNTKRISLLHPAIEHTYSNKTYNNDFYSKKIKYLKKHYLNEDGRTKVEYINICGADIMKEFINTNYWGKIHINYNGEVRSTYNSPVLGNILSESIKELVFNELSSNTSRWLSCRDNVYCRECVFQHICPPTIYNNNMNISHPICPNTINQNITYI